MGVLSKSLVVNNLRSILTVNEKGHVFSAQKRPVETFVFIFEGSLTFECRSRRISVSAPSVVFVPSGLDTKTYFEDESNITFKYFFSVLEGECEKEITVFEPSSKLCQFMQSTSDSNRRGYQLYSDFYKFLSLLEEKREIDPRFLKVHALMLEIEKNYSQNLKISQYAKTLLTSESSLRSLFKEYTGYSIIDYRNRLRVERANELILDGMKSCEAALSVGFSSPAFFCRMSKKYKT